MGAGYAKRPEVVTGYAKTTPPAGGSKDIQDIAHGGSLAFGEVFLFEVNSARLVKLGEDRFQARRC